MEPRDVLAYLKRIPAFRDLEDVGSEELLRLVPFVQQRTFQPGETLLHGEESAPDRTLILVGDAFGSSPPKRDRMAAMKSADRAPFWDAQAWLLTTSCARPSWP